MSEDGSAKPLWHGRFAEGPSEELLAFTQSLSFDIELARDDLDGSRAHVRGLERGGLLDDGELQAILDALDRVETELGDGSFSFEPTDEDIHTAVERRVTEIAGPAGAKLHTGRSRNDQVATDLRLWLRRHGHRAAGATHELQTVLVQRAEQEDGLYLPGYTHLQRAQPVLLAHHLLAHFWALARDFDRWRDLLMRANVSPLGAGALAGSSLPLDPDAVAVDLGFDRRFENSLDAVSDRDFVAEALFVAALEQVHLSRIGEEIVLWATEEFGFVRLPDAYSTGSSMLPHKKNPDIAELVRGKSGRVIGHAAGFLATLKGLPLSYNRDLQEDKEPLFDTMSTVRGSLSALRGLMATLEFVPERMQKAADTPVAAATDLAETMVRQGIPFREAHAEVGAMVRRALEDQRSLQELAREHPALADDTATLFTLGEAVRRRRTPGGAGHEPVHQQLAVAARRLAEQAEWLNA